LKEEQKVRQKREKQLYDLSERLGIEIYVLEVGRKLFLPEQLGTGGTVRTKAGATVDWMATALENPTDPLGWTHTHPNMNAFFSSLDEDGAHALYDMVRRPINAVVLGRDAARHTELIDEKWIEDHPFRPPLPQLPLWSRHRYNYNEYGDRGYYGEDYWRNRENGGYRWKDREIDDFEKGPDGIYRRKPRGARLRKALNGLLNQYGQTDLLKALEDMNVIHLINREVKVNY
jgi:hypothetical protein